MIESRTWFLLALFVIVLVALLNLSTIEENAPPPLLGRAIVEEFDYGMTDVERTHFDENGHIATQLSANALYHFPQQKKIKLDQPVLRFNMADDNWQLSSKKGLLFETSKELNLQEQVELIKASDQSQSLTGLSSLKNKPLKNRPSNAISMKMSELLFNLKQQIAFSPYPVELNVDGWKIKGVGLSIDVEKQQLTLLDKVFATNEKSQAQ